jgi:sterol desaturase/sphingolipid hydroxylase (fatty acid hydroxylase superfamily)
VTGTANLFWAAVPVLVFAVMAMAEWQWPRRALISSRLRRWPTHVGLTLANRAVLWLLARVIAVPAVAIWASANGMGVLNLTELPIWAEWLFAFVALDFAMWVQHLAAHRIPFFWRMHKVHHADRDLDVSTAVRFHPFEILASTIWKALSVVILGVSAPVFIAFELWLAANALFNHSNIELPPWLDRAIRPFLVTPDMHLLHHSSIEGEQRRNYGFALTVWDRIFGTYQHESVLGRSGQAIGLADVTDDSPNRLGWSLKLPLT